MTSQFGKDFRIVFNRFAFRYDARIKPELIAFFEFFRRARSSDDFNVFRFCQLQRGESHTRTDGVNQKRFVFLQITQRKNRVVRGNKRFGNCGGFRKEDFPEFWRAEIRPSKEIRLARRPP